MDILIRPGQPENTFYGIFVGFDADEDIDKVEVTYLIRVVQNNDVLLEVRENHIDNLPHLYKLGHMLKKPREEHDSVEITVTITKWIVSQKSL